MSSDTIAGAHEAVKVAREMAARGQRLRGVRIDSGDLLALGRQVRRILDEAGFDDVQIVASGGLDEFHLDELSQAGAPYDACGVGSRMGVSADAPWTDMAYKLVRYGERPVLKLSVGKPSLPDAKQVFRVTARGRLQHDLIARHDERVDGAEPLLRPVMAGGRIAAPLPSIEEMREQLQEELGRLDERYRAIRAPDLYPVRLSPGLQALNERMERQAATEWLSPQRHAGELGES